MKKVDAITAQRKASAWLISQVDATSGQVLADPLLAQELVTHARDLARSSAPSAE